MIDWTRRVSDWVRDGEGLLSDEKKLDCVDEDGARKEGRLVFGAKFGWMSLIAFSSSKCQ